MNTYAFIDEQGGILQVYRTTQQIVPCADEVDDRTHYFDGHDIVLKKPLEYEVEHAGLSVTLTGLPPGLLVDTNGQSAQADETPLTIEYDVPGTYALSFSGLVEYTDVGVEVTVGDP
ncbi:hypothetical protein [Vreelandella sp. GE22]